MKGLLKWLLAIAGAVVVIVIAAIIILPQVIDPNDYRDQISQAVYEETGMTLAINGKIDWSVFPWVGLSINDMAIDDTRKQPLGTLKHIAVKVKVLPLLQKKLDISALELDGLNLNMLVDKNGNANWQPANKSPVSDQPAAAVVAPDTTSSSASEPTNSEANGSSPLLSDLNIAGVMIKDLTISYQDIPADQKITIKDAQLTTGAIQFGQPFELTSSFDLENKNPAIKARIGLNGLITPDPENASYKIDDLKFTVTPGDVTRPESVSITGNVAVKGKQLTGQISVEPVDITTVLMQLKLPAPALNGGDKVLRKVSIGTRITANEKSLSLTDMYAVVDNNELKGRFAVTDLKTQAITFDITGNDIVVDPYLPVTTEDDASAQAAIKTESTAGKAPAGGSAQPAQSSQASASANTVIIPVELIKTLNIKGKAQLASLTVKEFRFEKPTIEVKAVDGHAQITNLSAGFYEGSIKSSAGIDVRGRLSAKPQVSAKADISSISLPALAKQLADLDKVTGKANASMKVLTHGLTQDQLTKGMNGTVDFNIADGALLGTNFNEMVCGVIAKVRKKEPTKTDWPEQTAFRKLQGSVRITNGVARNNDLTASLDGLNLKGDGYVDLVNQSLDYHMGLTITGDTADAEDSSCKINEKYAGIAWPVRCEGKLGSSGLCGIDDQRLGKTIAKIAEKDVKNKLQKKLEEKFGGSLKGLFN